MSTDVAPVKFLPLPIPVAQHLAELGLSGADGAFHDVFAVAIAVVVSFGGFAVRRIRVSVVVGDIGSALNLLLVLVSFLFLAPGRPINL